VARRPDLPMFVAPEWIEAHCVVPDGFRAGAPFKLYGYQLEYFANFYRVRGSMVFDSANPVLGPAFVFRRGLLVGPQKLGKGPHTAAHVCVEGAGPALFAGWAGVDDGYVCADHGCGCGWEYAYDPGEPMGMLWPTPLVQITAVSGDQTENIYDALRPMIENGPLGDVIPKTGEEFIRLPGGGRVDTVTSSAMSRLGQRITFAAQDEVGLWTRLNKMSKVADTQYRNLSGMGGRASLTTNMWDPTEKSVAQREYESNDRDVYRQCDRPPSNLRYDKPEDRRKIHRIVYPSECLRENGGHLDLASVEAEAESILKHDPAQAARFYGNIPAVSGGQAVDPVAWAAKATGVRPVAGARIGLGFDGSISNDSTYLVGCTAEGVVFEVARWERPIVGDKPDRSWRVPRTEVKAKVREVFAEFSVGRMFGDPPKWETELDEWADEFRLPDGDKEQRERVLLFDTFQSSKFARVVSRFVTDVSDGALTHCGDERLTDHVLAAVKRRVRVNGDDTDNRTLYVIDKPDDGRKIDGCVAAMLAYEAAMTMPAETVPARPMFSLT
jgi:hypothetical protein